MEYPHWLMIAGAVLVAFGFVGLPSTALTGIFVVFNGTVSQ
jgi:hypothetical protein